MICAAHPDVHYLRRRGPWSPGFSKMLSCLTRLSDDENDLREAYTACEAVSGLESGLLEQTICLYYFFTTCCSALPYGICSPEHEKNQSRRVSGSPS